MAETRITSNGKTIIAAGWNLRNAKEAGTDKALFDFFDTDKNGIISHKEALVGQVKLCNPDGFIDTAKKMWNSCATIIGLGENFKFDVKIDKTLNEAKAELEAYKKDVEKKCEDEKYNSTRTYQTPSSVHGEYMYDRRLIYK